MNERLLQWFTACVLVAGSWSVLAGNDGTLWERLETTGGPVLFDMHRDPEQQTNLAERPEYTRIKNSLQAELTQFFDEYSDPAYDLWGGGVAKGSVDRPEIFRALYGEQWQPTTPIKPAFEE